MVTEQDKTLEALQAALQMEIDGKEFYLKAGQESGNEAGKKLFQSLAAEEDFHRQKFVEVYDAVRNKRGWPRILLQPDRAGSLKTVFAQALKKLGSGIKVAATELDAVKTAMDMENNTYDFYMSQVKKASYDASKDFYQRLAAEETTHHLVLLDYYEYLEDPAGWFVKKERPSLDGG